MILLFNSIFHKLQTTFQPPFFEAKMESFCVVFMIMDQENWIVVAWTMKNSQGPEEYLNN